MPLSLQRPAQSTFSGRRIYQPVATDPELTPEKPPEVAKEPEAVKFHNFLNFFPMQTEQQEIQKDRQAGKPTPVPSLPAQRTARPMQRHVQPHTQSTAPPQHFQQQPQQRHMHPAAQHHTPHPAMQPAAMSQPQRPVQPTVQAPTTPQHFQQSPQQWTTQPPIQPATPPQLFQQQQPQGSMQPPTHSQTAPQAPPPTPSPENAAAHFRSINKGLPDGVMYEPLDDETMRLLKSAKNPPAVSQPATPTPPSLPTTQPTIPSKIADTLQRLAQNEHNAKTFYTEIAHNASNEASKKSLVQLAKDCETRLEKYTELIQSQFNTTFAPEDKEINTNLPFANAISLAIAEENKSLSTLTELLDQTEGTSLERQIERVINKKVVAHQLLLSITLQ